MKKTILYGSAIVILTGTAALAQAPVKKEPTFQQEAADMLQKAERPDALMGEIDHLRHVNQALYAAGNQREKELQTEADAATKRATDLQKQVDAETKRLAEMQKQVEAGLKRIAELQKQQAAAKASHPDAKKK